MRTLPRPRALGPRSLGAELTVQLATPMTELTRRISRSRGTRRPPRHHRPFVVACATAPVRSAQQLSELRRGQACLTQNGSHRAAGERAVQRHDDHPSVGMPQLRVTALGRGVREPGGFKCSNNVPTGDLRQGRTHAGMRISIGVTSG